MRAVVVDAYGPIETTRYGEFPDPVPKPDELLVEVRATAANLVDIIQITGAYQFRPPVPFVPGKGPAGVVRAAGAATTGFAAGDRVLAMAELGGFAASIAVPANICYRLPDAMSFVDAASMALVYDTAWFALRERGRVKEGETVLVLGATGGVGLAAVALAKAFGCRVLAAAANPAKFDLARAAGADSIVDLSRPDLNETLREKVFAETGGRGADVVVDPVGGDIFDAAIRAVAWRGRLVVVGFAAGRIPTLRANYLLVKNIEVSGLQISDYRRRMPGMAADCFREIFALYEAGKIRALPTATLPIARYLEALVALRDRTVRGRIVLTQGG